MKDTFMAKSSPADVIDAYRRRQERKSLFTFGEISTALLFLFIVASSVYVIFTGRPELPTLVDLKTNTPTFTPSITPTPTQTATITLTPTETPDLASQCDCPSPEILVVTATFSATDTAVSLPTATATNTIVVSTPTATLQPTETPVPTQTYTASPTATATPTQTFYTVQANDTLGGIALRYGVSIEAIQSLNNLDTTMIYVGQVLQIPSP
jgi:LysM repeat protein